MPSSNDKDQAGVEYFGMSLHICTRFAQMQFEIVGTSDLEDAREILWHLFQIVG